MQSISTGTGRATLRSNNVPSKPHHLCPAPVCARVEMSTSGHASDQPRVMWRRHEIGAGQLLLGCLPCWLELGLSLQLHRCGAALPGCQGFRLLQG